MVIRMHSWPAVPQSRQQEGRACPLDKNIKGIRGASEMHLESGIARALTPPSGAPPFTAFPFALAPPGCTWVNKSKIAACLVYCTNSGVGRRVCGPSCAV